MRKIIFAIFINLVFLLNTKAQINYHIYGTIDRTDVDKVYLYIVGERYIDSAAVKEGQFDMKGSYENQTTAFISTKIPFSGSKIILDNGEYNVKLDTHLRPNIVSTSINHNLWMGKLNSDEIKANKKAKDSLLDDFALQIEKGNYNLSAQYLEKYRDIQLKLLNYYKKLASDHPDCYITPYLLKEETILTQENFGSTFEKLSLDVKNNKWGQQLKALLEQKVTTKPDKNQFYLTILGSKANTFNSRMKDGKNFDMASLKGKWILLDFWASWCGPCRAEVPFLKKAYDQLKDKNFVISSVSIDNNKASWQKALEEDKTPRFIHTNIATFGKSDAYKYYQVNAIPSNFLINPDGRIIAMNLRGDHLIEMLTRLIK
jgi:thiol-disulfide isomerase/thioredoxin